MRVLVACEFSGIVRDAFAARGHDVWSCDFVADKTTHGRISMMLNIIDEFTRECLSIKVNRKIRAQYVWGLITT